LLPKFGNTSATQRFKTAIVFETLSNLLYKVAPGPTSLHMWHIQEGTAGFVALHLVAAVSS
jgi:hypothetical protein